MDDCRGSEGVGGGGGREDDAECEGELHCIDFYFVLRCCDECAS